VCHHFIESRCSLPTEIYDLVFRLEYPRVVILIIICTLLLVIILIGLSATELRVLEGDNIFFFVLFFVLSFLAWSDTQDAGLSITFITYHNDFLITPLLLQNVFMQNDLNV
jgi:hypothetical protein